MDEQTERRADRQKDGWTDRKTDGPTHIHTDLLSLYVDNVQRNEFTSFILFDKPTYYTGIKKSYQM